MNKQFTVDYFIAKFEAIPEDKWVGGVYNDTKGRCCALGHCGMRNEYILFSDSNSKEPDALWKILKPIGSANEINDGTVQPYNKIKHPKQRILAALRDIKKMQESSQMLSSEPNVQERDATKTIVANSWEHNPKSFTNLIPIVDEVVDQTKELIEN